MISVSDSSDQMGKHFSDQKRNNVEETSFFGRMTTFQMYRWFILAWTCPCGRRASGCKMLMDVPPEFRFVNSRSLQITILNAVAAVCRLGLRCRSNTVKEISALSSKRVHSLKTPHIVQFCPVVDQLFTLFRGFRFHHSFIFPARSHCWCAGRP